jgi:response regulator of citrate/malate metabolism
MTRDDDSGEFTEKVSDDDILAFFDAGQRPFHGAVEVAEEFGITQVTAHRRLEALADVGEVEKVEIGDRIVIWWRPRD